MEPKSTNQFEQGALGAEFQPSLSVPERQKKFEDTPERPERSVMEQAPMAAPVSVSLPTSIPLPHPVQVSQATVQVTDDNPATAGDDDLIEKEWVDKAKRIIADTRDDPYRREREVGRLQADYLQKRYSKTIGKDE
jgi:hypothetical protein